MESSSVAAPGSAVTVDRARAAVDLLTLGLPEEDRRMAALGILTILHDLHTRRGRRAPAWLVALMAEACSTAER